MTATEVTRVTLSQPAVAGWLRLAAADVRRTPMTSVLLIASWIFFVWAAVSLHSPVGTLEPMYGDHLRHVRYVLDFPKLGLGVYSTAARDLTPLPGVGGPVWPNLPYLYPPLALLLFTPLAAAISSGASIVVATKGFIVGLLTVSHLAGYLLNRVMTAREGSPLLRGAMVTLFIISATFWSLNAQYEAIPALFIIMSGSARTTTRAALWGLVAIALKFQSLLIVPFLVWRVIVDVKAGQFQRPDRASLAIGGFLALLTGVALALLRNDLSPVFQNRIGWHDFSSPHAVVAALMTAWVVAFSLLRRDFGEAITVLLVYSGLACTAVFQAWYVIIVLALVAHYRRPARWETFVVWYVGLMFSLQTWPNPFRFWALITAP